MFIMRQWEQKFKGFLSELGDQQAPLCISATKRTMRALSVATGMAAERMLGYPQTLGFDQLSLNLPFLKTVSIYFYLYVFKCLWVSQCTRGAREQRVGVSPLLPSVGTSDGARVGAFDSRLPCLLSHLPGPGL